MEKVDVVVVGAGQAGLGAAKVLGDHDLEVVVLERGRIGETWLSQRWDSFTLNTPNWANGLPGASYQGDDPEGFESHHDLVRHFEAYVARFGLDVRVGVEVTSVAQAPGRSRFLVEGSANGHEVAMESGAVVVASGILQTPRIPSAAAAAPAEILQLTTGTYRNAQALPEGSVVVVGGGQSGGQIVEDLLENGRRVFYSISNAPRLPRRYRGRDVMDWFLELGVWDVQTSEVEDPAELTATNPLLSGVGRLGRSLSYQYLAGKGATILGRLEGFDGGTLLTDGKAMDYIRHADQVSTGFRTEIDDYVEATGSPVPPAEADPGDEPLGEDGTVDCLSELDLAEAHVTTIIWSTGFTADFSWLRLPVVDDDGRPVHHNGVAEVPGIYFIGFPWLSKRKSGIVLGVDEDAKHVAEEASAFLAGVQD